MQSLMSGQSAPSVSSGKRTLEVKAWPIHTCSQRQPRKYFIGHAKDAPATPARTSAARPKMEESTLFTKRLNREAG